MVHLIDLLFRRNVKSSTAAHLALGAWGERMAVRTLKKSGWRILGSGVRFGPKNELDIVARDGDTLVFVEVKTRRNETFARPGSAVGRDKQRSLSRAAMRYLRDVRERPAYIRFDIIEVVGEPNEKQPLIRHLRNAFPLDRRYHLQQ